jgi:hypothetical protein
MSSVKHNNTVCKRKLNIARFLYIRASCEYEEYRDAYTQRFRTYTLELQGKKRQGIGRTYVDRHVDYRRKIAH